MCTGGQREPPQPSPVRNPARSVHSLTCNRCWRDSGASEPGGVTAWSTVPHSLCWAVLCVQISLILEATESWEFLTTVSTLT